MSNLITPLSSIKNLPSSISLKLVIFPRHPTLYKSFEVSNLSKERFEEVCNLRQPLTLDLDINCFNQLD